MTHRYWEIYDRGPTQNNSDYRAMHMIHNIIDTGEFAAGVYFRRQVI